MKIAQIAPLHESVPPTAYGGTERVVAYLTDALVDAGHDVTLFASADSETKGHLVPCCPRALRLDPDCADPLARHILQIQEVVDCAHTFDIVHFHVDYLHFPFTQQDWFPHLTTLHGRLNIADLQPLYKRYSRQPVVSISYSQRQPLPQACWVGNVYHGLPRQISRIGEGKGDYLAFIGRASPEKGLDRAIDIALRAGRKLKIGAKVDKVDQLYFDSTIKPLLDNPLIEFLGEIDESGKYDLLAGAECLLFPIDWPEPFGMVMIEAMAAGTPVLAFRRGSVPEIIEDGINGFIVESVSEALEKLPCIPALSRTRIRAYFEKRFSAERMASDYVQLYQEQITRRAATALVPVAVAHEPAVETTLRFNEENSLPH